MIFLSGVWGRLTKLVMVLIAAIFSLSMTTIDPYNLLTPEDQQTEASEKAPALTSETDSTPPWESFNTWQCFSTETIELECSELDSGANRVPTLRLRSGSTLHDFSLDPEPGMNCEQTLTKWAALLENQRSFCIYAAYLQKYRDNPFKAQGIDEWHLWIVTQIKTAHGYWTWSASQPESIDLTEPDID